jgi:curved DNA-binding protein CbpA
MRSLRCGLVTLVGLLAVVQCTAAADLYCGETDCYSVLSLPRSASAAKVRKAYKKAALESHPDKVVHLNAVQQKEATAKFIAVQHAFKVLSTETTREAYDDYLDNPDDVLMNSARYYHGQYTSRIGLKWIVFGFLLFGTFFQRHNQIEMYSRMKSEFRHLPEVKTQAMVLMDTARRERGDDPLFEGITHHNPNARAEWMAETRAARMKKMARMGGAKRVTRKEARKAVAGSDKPPELEECLRCEQEVAEFEAAIDEILATSLQVDNQAVTKPTLRDLTVVKLCLWPWTSRRESAASAMKAAAAAAAAAALGAAEAAEAAELLALENAAGPAVWAQMTTAEKVEYCNSMSFSERVAVCRLSESERIRGRGWATDAQLEQQLGPKQEARITAGVLTVAGATAAANAAADQARRSGEREVKLLSKAGQAWEEEELRLLTVAAKKFPGGSVGRWDKMSEFVGTRTADEVRKQCGALKGHAMAAGIGVNGSGKQEVQTASAALGVGGLKKTGTARARDGKQETAAELADAAMATAAAAAAAVAGGAAAAAAAAWTAAEQQRLEAALRQFPASAGLDKQARWKAISEAVGSRGVKECAARYKEVALLMRSKTE